MTVKTSDLALNVCFDRDIAWWRGGSCRYLVFEITAGNAKADADRPHHDLAIAIDASSSMAGIALSAVQDLAKALINRLGSSDSIAIISFADEARTELEFTAADDIGKAAARAAIDGIELRTGSNFAEGWLAAAEEVAAAKEKHPDGFAIVIIASDGVANRGLRRAEDLARHASELRDRGISTGAVAVGQECDLSLLLAIDDPSGLQAQFSAASGTDAVDALVANRLKLLPVIAEDVQIRMTSPPHTQVTALGAFSSERDGDRLVCSLGNIRAASRRLLVLKVILPEAEVSSTANFAIELLWTDRLGRRQRTDPVSRIQTFARGRDNSPQKRDLRTTLIVLDQWRLKLLRDLIGLNRQGRLREAEDHLAQEMKFVERYAHGIPEAGPLLSQLRLALPAVHRPWRERPLPLLAHRTSTVHGR